MKDQFTPQQASDASPPQDMIPAKRSTSVLFLLFLLCLTSHPQCRRRLCHQFVWSCPRCIHCSVRWYPSWLWFHLFLPSSVPWGVLFRFPLQWSGHSARDATSEFFWMFRANRDIWHPPPQWHPTNTATTQHKTCSDKQYQFPHGEVIRRRFHDTDVHRAVDEAHCCDTLRLMIGRHSKATSRHLASKGATLHLWSNSCTDQTCQYNI